MVISFAVLCEYQVAYRPTIFFDILFQKRLRVRAERKRARTGIIGTWEGMPDGLFVFFRTKFILKKIFE